MASKPQFSKESGTVFRERRRHSRKRVDSLEYIEVGPQNGGVLLDLSEGGIAVHLVGPLEKGQASPVWFKLEGSQKIEAEGRVIWTDEEGHTGGVEFLNLSRVFQRDIRAWLGLPDFEVREGQADSKSVDPSNPAVPAQPEVTPPPTPRLRPPARILELPAAPVLSGPVPAPQATSVRARPAPFAPPEDPSLSVGRSASRLQTGDRLPTPVRVEPRPMQTGRRSAAERPLPKGFFDLLLHIFGLARLEKLPAVPAHQGPSAIYDPEDPLSRNIPLTHEITARERSVWEALRLRDRTAYANMLAENYREICDGVVLEKADALRNFDQGSIADFSIRDVRVSQHDQRVAIISYKIRLRGLSQGQPLPDHPYYATSIWTNQRGSWVLTMSWGYWG